MNWDAYNKMVAEADALQDEDAKLAAYNRITDWLNVEDAVLDIQIKASRQRLKIFNQSLYVGCPIWILAVVTAGYAAFAQEVSRLLAAIFLVASVLGNLAITYIRLNRSKRLEAKAVATCKKEHGYE